MAKINETLRSDMWRACDILRRDNNVGGIMEYTEHIAWLLFLKFMDEEEKRRVELAEFEGKTYEKAIKGDLAWDHWASPEKIENWDTEFVNCCAIAFLPKQTAIQYIDGCPKKCVRRHGSPFRMMGESVR